MQAGAQRARVENAPANFAMFRRAALNVIKVGGSKGSSRLKFKQAGWADNFLRKIIEQIRNVIALAHSLITLDGKRIR
jgi:ribosomal protein S3AE